MTDNIITEKDWKLFRKMLPTWQERYMENLINDYEAILAMKRRRNITPPEKTLKKSQRKVVHNP